MSNNHTELKHTDSDREGFYSHRNNYYRRRGYGYGYGGGYGYATPIFIRTVETPIEVVPQPLFDSQIVIMVLLALIAMLLLVFIMRRK